ncbi:MAG: 1-deoxy-D-xylulose-5-phosphate reductoisomerase [Balneolaceae bacterium]
MQRLAVLGSTGSIGTQTLQIVEEHPDRFEIDLLTGNSNWSMLAEQVNRFRPKRVVLADESGRDSFEKKLTHWPEQLLYGGNQIPDLVRESNATLVLNALVGFAGFHPTCAALESGKRVALANKESLVVGGAVIDQLLDGDRSRLLPVDSEHSAMLQCLVGEDPETIEQVIITASGGPFRTWSLEQMRTATVESALDHPNWSMGSKITIDSATMMNKGLEIIEAMWLFELPIDKIEPVIHPQSLIHSLITFVDGSTKAQMACPDMRIPIIYALGFPERLSLQAPRMDWRVAQELTFEPVDHERFPCLNLAIQAGRVGGYAPAVLNAANEVAVARFLNGEIGYIGIARLVETSLETIQPGKNATLERLTGVDRETREWARSWNP